MSWSANNPRFCQTCRRVKSHCLCATLTSFSTRLAITFLVDKREQKSSRNTSWLMHQSLNKSVWGLNIEQISARLATYKNHSAILFLDDNALESSDFDANLSHQIKSFNLKHLIIVDGTWAQARALRKQLPDIPSIKLSQQYSAKNSRRHSIAENHLCTLEAVAAILLELEEHQALFDYSQILLDQYNALEINHSHQPNKIPPTK